MGPRFIAIIHQDGGCDYTIGCGIAVITLNSTTHDDAMMELRGMFLGDDREYRLDEIDRATIYAVSDFDDVDLDAWRNESKTELDAEAHRQKEASERAELERLSKKYAKG